MTVPTTTLRGGRSALAARRKDADGSSSRADPAAIRSQADGNRQNQGDRCFIVIRSFFLFGTFSASDNPGSAPDRYCSDIFRHVMQVHAAMVSAVTPRTVPGQIRLSFAGTSLRLAEKRSR